MNTKECHLSFLEDVKQDFPEYSPKSIVNFCFSSEDNLSLEEISKIVKHKVKIYKKKTLFVLTVDSSILPNPERKIEDIEKSFGCEQYFSDWMVNAYSENIKFWGITK